MIVHAPIIMIRKNLINGNLIELKKSEKSGKILFNEYMSSFRPETEQCPNCMAKGNCIVFAYYHRYLIDFLNGRPDVTRIRVLRVVCTNCGATHAILFDPIIPYEQHSLFFILNVLAVFHLHIKSIVKICSDYEISVSTFYRWKKLFQSHRKEWKGATNAIEATIIDSILELFRKDPFADFARDFFSRTGMSFMQSHKNPSRCQRRLKSDDSEFP